MIVKQSGDYGKVINCSSCGQQIAPRDVCRCIYEEKVHQGKAPVPNKVVLSWLLSWAIGKRFSHMDFVVLIAFVVSVTRHGLNVTHLALALGFVVLSAVVYAVIQKGTSK